ncbi:hypothetical protein [uncultured Rikenella sp.]|uniref:hypothetical protein n=1 Tax=uncultured Rikenella sp. TaxID=368003 RepID=UPI0025D74D4E|nr:hypothetical protein [uncultured Rikenella sp.]
MEYAKENYKVAPDNSYHITACFQCLLCKHNRSKDDERIMHQLIEHVKESFIIPDKEEVETGMALLWKVRTPGQDRTQLYNEIKTIQKNILDINTSKILHRIV